MAREKLCTKVYVDADGGETRSAHPGATKLEFRFGADPKAPEQVEVVTLADLPEEVRTCAAWHGLSQTLGDTYAGAKGDLTAALDAFQTKFEVLAGGQWVEKREGVGPKPSSVAAAVKAALEANGETVDDDRMAAIMSKLKTAEQRKAAVANPAINAQYEAIKLANAKAKAKAAAAKAKDADEGIEGF